MSKSWECPGVCCTGVSVVELLVSGQNIQLWKEQDLLRGVLVKAKVWRLAKAAGQSAHPEPNHFPAIKVVGEHEQWYLPAHSILDGEFQQFSHT